MTENSNYECTDFKGWLQQNLEFRSNSFDLSTVEKSLNRVCQKFCAILKSIISGIRIPCLMAATEYEIKALMILLQPISVLSSSSPEIL